MDRVGLGENIMGDTGMLGLVHKGRVSEAEIGVSKFGELLKEVGRVG